MNFSVKNGVYFPDENGKYVLGDDGKLWTDGERLRQKLFQCGPNEYTTHNLEPSAGNYRRDGTTYFPDTEKGRVTISGKFPLYCTNNATPVYVLPCGNFTLVPYSVPFADLVRLYEGAKNRDQITKRERKKFRSMVKEMTMTFHCCRCGKRYESANLMKSYCSDECRVAVKNALYLEKRSYYIPDEPAERVERDKRWKDVPYQDEIAKYCREAEGAMIHAFLFPLEMQKPASIILDRYRREGYLKILRIDPSTGVKIYVHV